ncbi:MAG: cytochrome c [Thermodesulfobacteriota bacterium]
MRTILWIAVFAITLAFAGTAMAADGGKVFTQKCSACHGAKGEGTAMAPAFKGNAFLEGDEAAIKEVIVKGRAKAAKKYPKFPIDMLPQKLSDDEVTAVIAHIKSL